MLPYRASAPAPTTACRRARSCLAIVAILIASLAAHAQAANGGAAPDAAPDAANPAAGSDPSARISERVEGAVVKIFSTMRYPDVGRPWTKQAPADATGTGVVLEGHRILTNAHVVLYASQIQVQANQEGDKYSARVLAVAPGIDLAVLQLEDESFFDRHAPLERSHTLPEIKDSVLAYGFPVGGTSLSITKGIVSRIEFAAYNATASGLRIQIDAAINPGNSGGPATVGDKMIGLAFSHLGNAQNIGYIIPNEEIDLFLADIADGHYDGKPAMLDYLQTLENPVLRSRLKLDASVHGIIVNRPARTDPDYPLREWDVITRVADTPVDDQGMILVGKHLRVALGYGVQRSAHDGKVPITLVRDGRTLTVDLPVASQRALLIPDLTGEYPPYFIYGPLVFSKVTSNYVQAIAHNPDVLGLLAFAHSPMITQRGDERTPDREELVLVPAPLFPHKMSEGYSNPSGSVVYSVNGVRIRSLAHLVQCLRDLRDEFVTFEFDSRGGEALVFRRKEIIAATEGILSDNGVRAQGSPDMMAIWDGKPGDGKSAATGSGRPAIMTP
jgi:S1-C subfamily serine protease